MTNYAYCGVFNFLKEALEQCVPEESEGRESCEGLSVPTKIARRGRC